MVKAVIGGKVKRYFCCDASIEKHKVASDNDGNYHSCNCCVPGILVKQFLRKRKENVGDKNQYAF
jgi:hypothetical protein